MKTIGGLVLLLAAIRLVGGQTTSPTAAPFTLTITALHLPVKVGEPAMIHIVLKSTSKNEFQLPQERHVGDRGEMNYNITVKDAAGAPLADSDEVQRRKSGHGAMQRSAIIRSLNYGDEIAEDCNLNNVFKITAPGEYTVQVERADPLWKDWHVRSNKLVIQVEP